VLLICFQGKKVLEPTGFEADAQGPPEGQSSRLGLQVGERTGKREKVPDDLKELCGLCQGAGYEPRTIPRGAREGSRSIHGHFYGLKSFSRKTTQFCASR
jgi:hypothetical protein